MEESWASKNKREREYFHHVVNLDRIYAETEKKKKIGQTIEFFKRIKKSKMTTLNNERNAENHRIEKENHIIERVMSDNQEHYLAHVLRPQIGLSEPTILCNSSMSPSHKINHLQVNRERRNKKINEENKMIASRLKFITSSFSTDASKTHFKNYLQARPIKHPADSHKTNTMENRTGLHLIDSDGMTEQFRNRVIKGVSFKEGGDKFKMILGKQLDREALKLMLDNIQKRKEEYESQYMPPRKKVIECKSKTNNSVSKVSIGIQKDKFSRSNSHASLTATKPLGKSSTTDYSSEKTVKISVDKLNKLKEARELEIKRKREAEDLEIREDFKKMAPHLFPKEDVSKKKVVFAFDVKSNAQFHNFYVSVNGASKFENIGKKGSISIPWASVIEDPLIQLEFMTSQGKSEIVQFDLSKRHSKLELSKLEGFKLSATVDVK